MPLWGLQRKHSCLSLGRLGAAGLSLPPALAPGEVQCPCRKERRELPLPWGSGMASQREQRETERSAQGKCWDHGVFFFFFFKVRVWHGGGIL